MATDGIGKATGAINAYLNTAKITDKGVSAGDEDKFSFGNLVKSTIDQVVANVVASLASHLPFRSLSTIDTNVKAVSHPELSNDAIELLGCRE